MITIPKKIAWGVIVTIVTAILSSFIALQIQVVTLQNNIELVKINSQNEIDKLRILYEKDHKTFNDILAALDKNTTILHEIEKKLQLKQDRKFIE